MSKQETRHTNDLLLRLTLRSDPDIEDAATEIARQADRIATLESDLAARDKRIAELEAIVEKLPRTADGVVAVPGTRLYPLYPVLPEDGHPDFEDAARLEMCITDPLSGEFIREYDGLLIDTCYSTHEAAEQALAARDATGGGGA